MNISKMAGSCLIIFGIINVLHEIHLKNVGSAEPGIAYALGTSILFTVGVALLLRRKIRQGLATIHESKIN